MPSVGEMDVNVKAQRAAAMSAQEKDRPSRTR
jgi:hypothetical protein